jgi:hypothetical protein
MSRPVPARPTPAANTHSPCSELAHPSSPQSIPQPRATYNAPTPTMFYGLRWKLICPRHCEQRMAVWVARDLYTNSRAGRSVTLGEVCTGTCFLPFFDSISAHLPRRRARLGTQLCVLSGSLCMSCMPPATGALYSTNVLVCQDWTPGWCVHFRGTSSGTVITSTSVARATTHCAKDCDPRGSKF